MTSDSETSDGAAVARDAADTHIRVTKRPVRHGQARADNSAVRVDSPAAWWVRRVGTRMCV